MASWHQCGERDKKHYNLKLCRELDWTMNLSSDFKFVDSCSRKQQNSRRGGKQNFTVQKRNSDSDVDVLAPWNSCRRCFPNLPPGLTQTNPSPRDATPELRTGSVGTDRNAHPRVGRSRWAALNFSRRLWSVFGTEWIDTPTLGADDGPTLHSARATRSLITLSYVHGTGYRNLLSTSIMLRRGG